MALTDNLVSYWKLDSNSNDSLGVSNGTDTAITYSTPSKIGNAAQFNGTTSRVNLGTGNACTAGLTISMWVQTSAITGQLLFSKTNGVSAATDSYYVYYYNAGGSNMKIQGFVGSGTADYYTDSTIVSLASMSHVVFTDDKTTSSIYINGALNTSLAHTALASLNGAASRTWIGAFGSTPSLFMNGSIDEVGLWNRAITLSEVGQLYNGGAGLTYPFISAIPSRLMMMGVG